MTCQVFLQLMADNGYKAIPLAFPDCEAVGRTRDEALSNLKSVLSARLAQGELVTVEVGEPDHPWRKWSGVFKDDPTYDDFLAEIEAYRRQMDEVENDRGGLSS
jgi:predicted RNase H-like HicB family nuclease